MVRRAIRAGGASQNHRQLFRAARTLQMASAGATIRKGHYMIKGCDLTATVILDRLKVDEEGRKMILQTNPKLLEEEGEKDGKEETHDAQHHV
jgi:hypothetical protein